MLTAHLPAGRPTSRAFGVAGGGIMGAALPDSILPDLDMLWFHYVDHKAFHDHRYWVHAPGFWLVIAAITLPLSRGFARHLWWPALAFFAAIFVHLVLDGLAGSIMWLWPFDPTFYALVEVPPTRGHWILSFLTLWTMLAELATWIAALTLLLTARRRR
jgi:inner membrane protein